MSDLVLLHHPNANYIAKNIFEDLNDNGIPIKHVKVKRAKFPNGERYYKLNIDNSFSLIGKTSIYIASLTNDTEIFDMFRVGTALVQAGLKRRIFVVPFLAYLSMMDRAVQAGEIITAKCNSMLLGLLGSAGEGNIFVFLDLHYTPMLHYFEGPCLRMELSGMNTLLRGIDEQGFDLKNVVIGSTNLSHSNTVNVYANCLNVPVVFCRKKLHFSREDVFDSKQKLLDNHDDFLDDDEYSGDDFDDTFSDEKIIFNTPGDQSSEPAVAVVGDVKGKHVIIYDDMIRSGRTVLNASKVYLQSGAARVDVVTSHLACYDNKHIEDLIDSDIQKIIVTNSHPMTQTELVRSSDKFVVLDVSSLISQNLLEMLPSPEHPHRTSL